MATNRAVLTLAAKIADRLYRDYLDYLESCEQDRREGHRPHYCEHGTNMWTDYDNICGPCEDGLSMRDGLTRREYALDQSKRRWAECRKIAEAVATLTDLGVIIDAKPAWERMDVLLTP